MNLADSLAGDADRGVAGDVAVGDVAVGDAAADFDAGFDVDHDAAGAVDAADDDVDYNLDCYFLADYARLQHIKRRNKGIIE